MFRKAGITQMSDQGLSEGSSQSIERNEQELWQDRKIEAERGLVNGQLSIFLRRYVPWGLFFIGLVVIPALYYMGLITLGTVNMLGRYMAFAIMAVGLDLIWGYTGILSLCQAFFFALGGYAMGMYLAHHGGPEGIIDANNWKIPACLYVVYPYKVGEVPGDALVPWFWKRSIRFRSQ